MNTFNIVLPMFSHVIWVALLYAGLTMVRAPAVWGIGKTVNGDNPLAALEPRFSANLKNQFEWPMFFHIACVLLVVLVPKVSNSVVAIAWVFVFGRVLHSIVQIWIGSVKWRGVVFTINFLAVLAMWTVLLTSL